MLYATGGLWGAVDSGHLDKLESVVVHDRDVSAVDLLLRKCSSVEDEARLAGM